MRIVIVAIGLSLVGAPAFAGCLKGAAVGGVAGHVAGHHAGLGAAAGCAIGHRETVKANRAEKAKQDQQGGQPPAIANQ